MAAPSGSVQVPINNGSYATVGWCRVGLLLHPHKEEHQSILPNGPDLIKEFLMMLLVVWPTLYRGPRSDVTAVFLL